MTQKASSPGIGRPLRRLKPNRSTLILIGALGCGLLVSLLVFFISVAPFFLTSIRKDAPEAAFQAELDRSVPALLHELRISGVVVATVIDGMPSHVYAYGYADKEHHRPMRTDSLFRVASISKSLTAWGVLKLAEQGRIDLDKPVETYLPAWPLPPSRFPSTAITTRELLNHTSGMSEGADEYHRTNEPAKSAKQVLDEDDAALIQPVGLSYLYSVPAYTVLQMLIETQSHQNFSDYMRDTVLGPLGMTSSSFDWNERQRDRMVTPYGSSRRPSEVLIPDDTAADGLFSTGEDLARFIAAPLPGGLPIGAGVLTPGSVEMMYSNPVNAPRITLGAEKELPVLGSFIQRTPGQPDVVTNGGFDPGWSSRYYMVPTTGDGLVILTNSSQGRLVIGQIAAVWSAWRGLPALTMTSTYRSVTLATNIFIGVLTTLTVFLAGHFWSTWADQRRRRIQLTWAGTIRSLPELVLNFVVIGVWVGTHDYVRVMPSANGIGSAVVLFYTLIVCTRLLTPLQATPKTAAAVAPDRSRPFAGPCMAANS